jgi:hypothetical protein
MGWFGRGLTMDGSGLGLRWPCAVWSLAGLWKGRIIGGHGLGLPLARLAIGWVAHGQIWTGHNMGWP